MGFAIDVLADAGAFTDADVVLAAKYGPLPQGVTFAELMESAPMVTLAFIAGKFLEGQEEPPENLPLPVEFAAAVFLVRLYEYWGLFTAVSRKVQEEDTLDFQDICHLMWISAELGSLGGGFHARMFGYERAHQVLAAQLEGSAKGGLSMKIRADQWRRPVVAEALRLRQTLPHLGQKEIAKRLEKLGLQGLPDRDQVVAAIRAAEARGELPRSTKNQGRQGEEG